MKRYVFDIEGDGLYDTITRIHCIVIRDVGTGRVWTYHPGGEDRNFVDAALRRLAQADSIIGHNIIDFDLPVLKKLHSWEPTDNTRIVDTLVLSRLALPDRKGGHSLGEWGDRLGHKKPEHEDWSKYSKEMLHRCIEDVNINTKLYHELKKEYSEHDWGESIQLEHDAARILSQQERDGVYFDKPRAEQYCKYLSTEIEKADKELDPLLPVRCKRVGTPVSKPFLKNGKPSARAIKMADSDATIVGPFQAVQYVKTDLNSDKQVKEWLLDIGWQPTEYNYSKTTGQRTGPKLTEDSFDSLPDAQIGRLFKQRVQTRHRMGQISGWLDNIRPDGRIGAGYYSLTPTARLKHRVVTNIPKASSYDDGTLWWVDDDEPQPVYFGTEMRSLFCAPEGYKIVGHDASGLELRMLAHYMNDPAYTEILLNGDIHSHNQELAGLHTRASAKTFIYAFNYGAGDAKLGSIVEGGESEGAALRARFLRENPQLNRLLKRVQRTARERGYLVGLDGRKIWLRRNERGRVLVHKALNTLLQCAGAVVMKKSMVLLDEWATREQLDFIKVIDMHDEGQAQVKEEHAERYAELAVRSIVEAGKHFNLNVPLDAEADIGINWAETH